MRACVRAFVRAFVRACVRAFFSLVIDLKWSKLTFTKLVCVSNISCQVAEDIHRTMEYLKNVGLFIV